jgi:hypothetical protein
MMTLARAAALALTLTLASSARAAAPNPAAAKPASAKPVAAKADAKPSEASAADVKPAEAAPADAKPAAWKEYQVAESGFAVRLPTEPERTETSQGPMTLRTYGVDRGAGQTSFGVMCMTFDGVDGDLPPETLDQMAQAMTSQPGMKVTKDEKLTIGGRAARHLEVAGDQGDGKVAIRVVLGKGRVYQVMALGKGAGALSGPEVKTFFDSFRPLP